MTFFGLCAAIPCHRAPKENSSEQLKSKRRNRDPISTKQRQKPRRASLPRRRRTRALKHICSMRHPKERKTLRIATIGAKENGRGGRRK
jgi:hypothetical protein